VTTDKEAPLNLVDAKAESDLVLLTDPTEQLSAAVDQRLSFTIAGEGARRFNVSGLPRHATFDVIEGRFSWRPREGQEGVWVITFASDAEMLSPVSVRIHVHRAPAKVIDLR
jgi:hypothetical protein